MLILSSPSILDIEVESSGDLAHDHIAVSMIRNGLKKMHTPGGLLLEEHGDFLESPSVKMVPFSQKIGFSVLLACRFYPGLENFFYEMLSRWLSPGKKMRFHSFSSWTFSFKSNPGHLFGFLEARFFFDDRQECHLASKKFLQIESEIRLGALSVYQGNRVLDRKGYFSSEKNSFIHERISSLMHRRPLEFDYDVFGQMQYFFANGKEEFKELREPQHLSRMVCVFYLFRKMLKSLIEKIPEKRHISFKTSQVRLHSAFGVKKVTGVFVGLNFLKLYEIFEERHLVKAIKEHLPQARIVEGSQFEYVNKQDKIHIFYLEIEKEGESPFSFSEIRHLRKRFPLALENQVEKLMPSVFMPRNEEEVMKNILTLSEQLKYVKDIPQGYISFQEQSDLELTFTVIILRILNPDKEASLQKLFKELPSRFIFIEDRVKKVGILRGKYVKEATVFRLQIAKSFYLRRDHSVNLWKARQDVVKEVQRVIGEFRDYNGGMIANQMENLYGLKKLFPSLGEREELEVENFFHSVFPVETRSVVDPSLLKALYDFWGLFLEEEQKIKKVDLCLERGNVVLFARFSDSEQKEDFMLFIKSLGLSSSQCLVFYSKKQDLSCLGYILLGLPSKSLENLLEYLRDIALLSEELVFSFFTKLRNLSK